MTRPAVLFPDPVFVAVMYLREKLPGITVTNTVPNPRPETFVRVKRVGGTRNSPVTDRPRLDIHCWAPTDDAAVDLTALVRAHVLAMSGSRSGTTVYRLTEVGGPMELPDEVSDSPRYAFAVEFSIRGTDLE